MSEIVPLSSKELEAINFIEEYWHDRRQFPTEAEIKAVYKAPVDELFAHPTFIVALEARGIPRPPTSTQQLPTGLTQLQVAAALKYLDVEDKRTLATKLREIGVTTTQWYGWMKGARFRDFVVHNSNQDFEENLHEAQMGLRRAMENGNPNAIKLYYELTKRYNSNEGQIGNLKVVISQIIEAVQRHVRDPETLEAIAHDFEAILSGGGTAKLVIEERVPELKELL